MNRAILTLLVLAAVVVAVANADGINQLRSKLGYNRGRPSAMSAAHAQTGRNGNSYAASHAAAGPQRYAPDYQEEDEEDDYESDGSDDEEEEDEPDYEPRIPEPRAPRPMGAMSPPSPNFMFSRRPPTPRANGYARYAADVAPPPQYRRPAPRVRSPRARHAPQYNHAPAMRHQSEYDAQEEEYEVPETNNYAYAHANANSGNDGNGYENESYNKMTDNVHDEEYGNENDDHQYRANSRARSYDDSQKEKYHKNVDQVEHTPKKYKHNKKSVSYSSSKNKSKTDSFSGVAAKDKHSAKYSKNNRMLRERLDQVRNSNGERSSASTRAKFENNHEDYYNNDGLGAMPTRNMPPRQSFRSPSQATSSASAGNSSSSTTAAGGNSSSASATASNNGASSATVASAKF